MAERTRGSLGVRQIQYNGLPETQRMNFPKLLIEFSNIAQNTLCTTATTGRMIETDRCRAISVEPPALHFTIYVHT